MLSGENQLEYEATLLSFVWNANVVGIKEKMFSMEFPKTSGL